MPLNVVAKAGLNRFFLKTSHMELLITIFDLLMFSGSVCVLPVFYKDIILKFIN